MDKLNPIEAILGCEFKLTVNVSGLDSEYTGAKLYIDDVCVGQRETFQNGSVTFQHTSFGDCTVGEHVYSVVADNGGTGSSLKKKPIIYKNILKVYDDPTSTPV